MIMKKINIIFIAFCFLFTTNFNAQSLQLLDENDNVIENTTHYFYGDNNMFGQSYLHIKNLTGSNQAFGVKATLEYTPYTNSAAYFVWNGGGYTINPNAFAGQVLIVGTDSVVDSIPANGVYPSPGSHPFRFEPSSWMWTDCPNDSAIWRVTVFDPANSSDSSSVRIIYKCVESPDPTSVLESSNKKTFNAFPNPTNSRLNFSSKISGRLFDLLGNEILLFNQQSVIDISHLTKGVYFLKTNDSVIKIIKR